MICLPVDLPAVPDMPCAGVPGLGTVAVLLWCGAAGIYPGEVERLCAARTPGQSWRSGTPCTGEGGVAGRT